MTRAWKRRASAFAPRDIKPSTSASVSGRGANRRRDRHAGSHAIDAEGAPVGPVDVPGHQVPALVPVHEAVRLGATLGGLAAPVGVVESKPAVVAAGRGEIGQDPWVDARSRPMADVQRVRLQRVDLAPQSRREDLLELGQCSQRGLLDPGHRTAGRGPQPDRDSDGFLVVEQQRRQRRARLEPIAADRAARGVDRVAERAQAVDVVPDRPSADLEPVGELSTGPVAWRLEQREQSEESRRGSQDETHPTTTLGTKLA